MTPCHILQLLSLCLFIALCVSNHFGNMLHAAQRLDNTKQTDWTTCKEQWKLINPD